MVNFKLNLILASASPRRKELLGHLKLPFQVMTKNVPEESSAIDPRTFALEIAKLKGHAVSVDLIKMRPLESFFIVSSDTIVCLGNKIYGKPKDRNEARSILRELSGREHSVFTAVTVLIHGPNMNGEFSFVDESKVTFDTIPDRLLEEYLDTGDSMDKAGAYGIQGPSLTFISKVQGSYSNVVGFPLSRFVKETDQFFKEKFPEVPLWSNLF